MRISKLTLAALFTAASTLGTTGLPILAADPTPDADITVENALSGSYNVYQLFTGTFDASGHLGDLTVNPQIKNDLVKAIQHFDASFKLDPAASETDQANTLALKVQALCNGDNTKEGRAFANELAGILTSAPTSVVQAASGTISLTGLDTGYYLIFAAKDNTTAKTSALLVPAKSGTNTIALKATQPAATKTAVGYGETGTGNVFVDQEVSDGKVLPPTYTIKGTVASNIDDFSTYPYSIVDTLPAGLTTEASEVQSDWKVSITAQSGSKSVNLTSTAATTVNTDGTTITWAFTDLKAALLQGGITEADLASTVVSVVYTPVFDDQDFKNFYDKTSVLDAPFTNTAQIVFAASPYAGAEGTTSPTQADLPGSQVFTYSWNLKLTKQDENQKPVTGAAFEITDPQGHVIGNNITAADDGTFTFTGLKSGVEYTLKETSVPAGYQTIDPITFTISETTDASGKVSAIAVTKTSDPDKAAAFTVDDASVNGIILNLSGPIMPSTGQNGVLFAGALGAGLVAVSCVVLARNRKSRSEQ